MARETQGGGRKAASPALNGEQAAATQGLVEANGEAMSVAMKSSEAMLAGLNSLGSEMMAFGSTRLKENIDAADALTRCTTAADMFQVQCDYAHKATQQYADEVTRIIRLASRMAEQTMMPLEDRAKETLREINGDS